MRADMTEPADIARLMENVETAFGGVDILVNNVGGSRGGQNWDTSDDDWNLALDLNLFAAVRATRLAIPLMRQRGGGRIINITSVYGREAGGPMTYSVPKGGHEQLVEIAIQTVGAGRDSGQRGGAGFDSVSRRILGAAAAGEPGVHRQFRPDGDASGALRAA